MQAIAFSAPNAAAPLSETNRYSVTVYHDDGRIAGWGPTLAESFEIAQLAGRAPEEPADLIRFQGKIPGATIGPDNPLVMYAYSVPGNNLVIADWIDRKVFKAATAAMQRADNEIPDNLEV